MYFFDRYGFMADDVYSAGALLSCREDRRDGDARRLGRRRRRGPRGAVWAGVCDLGS